MAERRTEIMTFTGTLAGLGIAAGALLATVGKQELSSPLFIASAVIAALSAGAFVMAGFSAVPSWVRPMLQARRRTAPLIVNRWLYTTDGAQVQPLTVAMEVGLPGTGNKLKDDQPPWVRFVVTMACSHISADDDPDLHYLCFESLLEMPLVRHLVDSLTAYPGEVAWWRWSATRPGVHESVLGTYREDLAPLATARLELPTEGPPMSGRDGRCATMILHVEPHAVNASPAGPRPPEFWEERVRSALWLPKELARLLTDLGLRTSGDPAAKVGVRLEATRDIAEMVDITGLHPMRGSIRGSQAVGFFTADPEGKSADDAAATMLRDMMLYTVKTSAV